MAPSEEKVFFDRQDVRVTSARFIIDCQTFAMRGITSVRLSKETPKRTTPLLFAFAGVGFIVLSLPGVYDFQSATPWLASIGVVLLALGVLFWMGQKTEYAVCIVADSGEKKPILSRDGPFITGIVAALNESIVYRG